VTQRAGFLPRANLPPPTPRRVSSHAGDPRDDSVVIEKAQRAKFPELDLLRWARTKLIGVGERRECQAATQNQASAIGAGLMRQPMSVTTNSHTSAVDWPSWHPQPTRLTLKGGRDANARPAAYPPSDRLPASPSITQPAVRGSRSTSAVPMRWLALPFLPVRDRLPGGALGCRSLKQLSDQLGA
jgi:hypothetical protein